MKPSEQENAQLGAETLDAFFKQFEPIDPQGQIVLEYILELLCQTKRA